MSKKKNLIKIFVMVSVVLMFVVISIVVPLMSGSKGDSGTCCPEANSICYVGGDRNVHYYYKESGKCSKEK